MPPRRARGQPLHDIYALDRLGGRARASVMRLAGEARRRASEVRGDDGDATLLDVVRAYVANAGGGEAAATVKLIEDPQRRLEAGRLVLHPPRPPVSGATGTLAAWRRFIDENLLGQPPLEDLNA